ncbi:MAG: hypothetical protein CL897_03260 [Dehalococcoidia bacterium]|nr:hypothetical protein [Dehalococcoidia bacterium]|tara:strand:+ start:2445 stop:3236 length:792 start_codon:yes stop_codon:yes gene_type:complete
MAIRLIALDIDGTLLPYEGPNKGKLSSRLRSAVQSLVKDGRTVILASGRMKAGVIRIARELGLQSPFIAQEGCLISQSNGKILQELKLDRKLALAVSAYARETGHDYEWFSTDRYAVTTESPATKYYAELGEVTPEIHAKPEMLGIEPNGVGILNNMDQPSTVHQILTERYGDKLNLLDFPFVTVALAPGATKGNALSSIARTMGISAAETLAIGDSVNDVSMLHWAGIGLAVAKGHWSAHDAANEVLPDEEDAVAKALEGLL